MMECQCKSKNRHMFLSHILRQVNRFHQMFLWPPLNRKIQCSQNFHASHSVQTSSKSVGIVRNLRNVPEVTKMTILHFRLIIMNLEKVSENLKNRNGVFSGTGMPDMLDSAQLAIKTSAETSKNETLTGSQSVESLQKDVDKFVGHSQFFAGRRDDTTNLQQSRSRNSLQCDGQTATSRSESVNSVS